MSGLPAPSDAVIAGIFATSITPFARQVAWFGVS